MTVSCVNIDNNETDIPEQNEVFKFYHRTVSSEKGHKRFAVFIFFLLVFFIVQMKNLFFVKSLMAV